MNDPSTNTGLKRFLPRVGSPAYHVMLALVAMFILGPLGGVSAAFMNFSIGFFVTAQVLAGILGSIVTVPYGPEGKHGGNYIQTMAASVANMAGLGVLLQSMIWLGLPEPPVLQLVLYYLCIGMFGLGVGMLYTPILVDRMQLAFPSGHAVANILRAMTDKHLLKRSVVKLGGGMFGGFGAGALALNFENMPWLARLGLAPNALAGLNALHISASTFGAGMIVGARLAIPALFVGLIGWWQTPHLRDIGWLGPRESYRRVGYLIAMGAILGAAIVDIIVILLEAVRKYRAKAAAPAAEDWKRVNMVMLIVWIILWAAGIVAVGNRMLHQPVFYLLVAIGLSFVFVLVNGISQGISDWNPISSAFVVSMFILAALGLSDAGTGLMCGSILLIACCEGGDMQQDRSTGWRLGTNRIVQFRYQVIGLTLGAVLAVGLAKLFLHAYPVLTVNQLDHPDAPGIGQWQSAMTLKFAGTLRGITEHKPHVMKALKLGVAIGLAIGMCRKLLRHSARYRRLATTRAGRIVEFVLDSTVLASPYASSLAGFVELFSVIWWTAGGVFASLFQYASARTGAGAARAAGADVPTDMSTTSLVGGGLIAGDSLAALAVGLYRLAKTVL